MLSMNFCIKPPLEVHPPILSAVCEPINSCLLFKPVEFGFYFLEIIDFWGFPGGAVVENLSANAEDTGSSPGLGRSHMPRSN